MDKPFRVCAKTGCHSLTKDRFCIDHKDELENILKRKRADQDRLRGSAHQRGYTYKWSKARTAYLKQNWFCVSCIKDKSLHVKADVVDHIIPHKGDQSLFWKRSNWQALCKQCHDVKTAKEDGGFGRKLNGRGG